MRLILSILLLCVPIMCWSQAGSVLNQSRFYQIENPSYFGLNGSKKIGVLYSSKKIGETAQVNHQYFFGNITFLDQPFSLGIDLNNHSIQNSNYKIIFPKLSFVYQLQLNNHTYLLPSISFGYWSKTFNEEGLVFEDQINSLTGYINPETKDPLGSLLDKKIIQTLELLFSLTFRYFLCWIIFITNQPTRYLNKWRTPDKRGYQTISSGWGRVGHKPLSNKLPFA